MLKSSEHAPQFRLPTHLGKATTLGSALENGPVLLAFFKTSCPVCQLTLPFLARMANESGLCVIGISQDDPADTKEFREVFGVTFTTLIDNEMAGYPVSNAYAITDVPSLFLVEKDGVVSLAESGFSKAVLEELGARFGAVPFREGERVPAYKPG